MRALSRSDAGVLLDGGEDFGAVLLPRRDVPEGLERGAEIEVFLMLDSEDHPVATTATPLAMAGEFALLKVIAVNRVGAFLDWGMPKDLLLPFGEQPRTFRVGEQALVYVHVDKVSKRLLASAKLKKFVAVGAPPDVLVGDAVALRMAEKTDLGYMAIVDDRYWGMLPLDLGFRVPGRGGQCEGYIHRLGENGLVDLGLEPPGYAKVPDAAEQLAQALAKTEDGFLPLHDKSPPERVRARLGMSKKVFKQAVGALYKAGRIRLEAEGIRRVED